MTDIFDDDYMPEVKRLYPEFSEEGWHVEMVRIELDELDDPDISSMSAQIERESIEKGEALFMEDAIDKAVEELVIKCRPPNGWLFVRLVKENETPVLVIIPTPKQGNEL